MSDKFYGGSRINGDRVVVAKMETTTSTCDKSSQVGNAAARFKALQEIHLVCWKAGITMSYAVACGIIKAKSRAALSAPPRNCDRFDNADEAKKAIHGQYPLHIRPQDERDAVIDWLFAEAKGEQK